MDFHILIGTSLFSSCRPPVSLISTMQPFDIFSSKRRREASKSRSPGSSSLALISLIRMARPVKVESKSLCLKCLLPLYFNIPLSKGPLAFENEFLSCCSGKEMPLWCYDRLRIEHSQRLYAANQWTAAITDCQALLLLSKQKLLNNEGREKPRWA